ncbi:glutathione peroxidase [Roseibium hamelinense]|uniref:Glutathione peroxidase n=1 Tax=Roseibium hamelinense TaxID=150831 RepID=A0A562T9M4_9HYPH|nr:glutathione peroxidase [Roseibium hamelinense]MTI43491.1 glutathione peroxidase [Roseibium hamelinense]TWI89716.1 glutathione peroxidase [Roseibium hamelinense]
MHSVWTQFQSVTFVAAAFLSLAVPGGAVAQSPASAHAFAFDLPNGEQLPLSSFAGKAVLVVNTATECGFKNQIGDLQDLHERYSDKGLVVVGVPSNDFGGQEPRANDEIAGFCEARYGAKFPMTNKTRVKGEDAHPFYQWAVAELGDASRPYWNFHKYLIGPDGKLVTFFPTPTRPTSTEVTSKVEQVIAALPAADEAAPQN